MNAYWTGFVEGILSFSGLLVISFLIGYLAASWRDIRRLFWKFVPYSVDKWLAELKVARMLDETLIQRYNYFVSVHKYIQNRKINDIIEILTTEMNGRALLPLKEENNDNNS